MIEECLIIEFTVTGDDCPLAAASRSVSGTIDATPPQARRDGNALLRFSAPTDEQLSSTLDSDNRIRYLHAATAGGDRTNYRCLSKQPCVVHQLTDVGFMVESIQYRNGNEQYVGAVVGHDVLRGVLDRATETGGVTLKRLYPLGEADEGTIATRWDITPAQEEAIRTALRLGYFSVPRDVTARMVADAIGISKTAFLERLRRGLGGLLPQVFVDTEP